MKSKKMGKISLIITIMIIILVITGVLFSIKSSLNYAEETIERCKSKGWDGAKFKLGLTNDMICSNISQAEKDARGDD